MYPPSDFHGDLRRHDHGHDHLLASARYVKEKAGLPIRLNSNGLGNLYHKRDIVPELATVIDSVSISLKAPNA